MHRIQLMQNPAPSTLGREEEAKLALEHTAISPGVARLLCAAFLATIFAVPIAQSVIETRRNTQERQAQIAAKELPRESVLPQAFEVLSVLPSGEEVRATKNLSQAWNLIPTPQKMADFESALEDESLLVGWLLPRAQNALAGWPGVGNEQAYIGRKIGEQQWLHYRPDVDYLTSRGFLDAALLRVRQRGGDATGEAAQPDPLPAIIDFAQQLKRRNIELIVMPTPVKAMLQPETLSPRYRFGEGVLQNPSYALFREKLARAQIKVFDASEPMLQLMRRTKRPKYLQTDTHWTPEAMELSARELARFIRAQVKLEAPEPIEYTRLSHEVSNGGDIAEMLKLPDNQKLFGKQKVRIHPIQEDGEAWYPHRGADILLLGDSFSNIYSLEGMGWGESAGLAEQLSFELKRPVDSIINNAGGSHVTRERLSNELRRGKDRLRGKRLVIWQFAMRDLLIGDWKLLELPKVKPRPTL